MSTTRAGSRSVAGPSAAGPGTGVSIGGPATQALAAVSRSAQGHVKAAERLADAGRWEEAYHQLRQAVSILDTGPEGPQPVRAELDRLRREHASASEAASRDHLTASYNRRYLDDRLRALLDDPRGVGMTLAMADIDHFKQVNDRWGHPFGDRVLQRVVRELDAALSSVPGAFCARYGGEEFALVLPGIDPADAITLCESARKRVDRANWLELDPHLRVTISIGVAHSTTHPPDVEKLLADADLLLYAAKGAGRNAVAFRQESGGVALAGPASARRDIPQPTLF